MPIHNFRQPRGTLVFCELESTALEGNLLGDPAGRVAAVYLPEDYEHSRVRYPVFFYLAAYAGSGLKKISWQQFGESLVQRVDRLIAAGRMGPTVIVIPDCFTSMGGNQYVDSPILGGWEGFLVDELVPEIESSFRVLPGPAHRAVLGYSSGGYGALIQGLRHGEQWGALACHSGDLGFENLLLPEFPRTLTELSRYDGSAAAFLRSFWESRKVDPECLRTLMTLAMAASFDPDPEAFPEIRLPVDAHTCELDPKRWSNWLKHDPVHLVHQESCRRALLNLKAIFFDCGGLDQYHLQYGARRLSRSLESYGIPHEYEEFPDNHSDIDYRLDRSLPLLYQAVRA